MSIKMNGAKYLVVVCLVDGFDVGTIRCDTFDEARSLIRKSSKWGYLTNLYVRKS